MHKKSLRQFLRDRRARITPESVGLTRPTGQGRRAAGLSQQQVDQLLGRGIHTCNRLETGRYPNPPADLLRDLATLYHLDEHEWVMLHRYALEQDPPAPLHPESGYQVTGAWQEAVDGVGHMAYVSDAAWHILAHNQALPGMFPSRRVPENILRWMCLSGEARTVLADWANAWAPRVLPQLRAALAARRDPCLQQLEQDILSDPVAGPLYEAPGIGVVNHPDGDERPMNHPVHGPGWVTMCSASPDSSPGARLMILVFRQGPRRAVPRPVLRCDHTRTTTHTNPT
ncbi:helix-turn-helix domain-containing protein [Streptomyces sp. sk2.1]|uniref:MmyB family transcriptional regulator n=1 Tax=Streptomyces sp. sk2.1 TaxID=2478959 RepID=UPI0011E71690|nr:helix-turn-helix domain-containing protein [Streptomyces sp. sk2.1]TXS63814.1 XRE family transcriptional regulator [Streptomyces sp. sk2.1]